MTVELTDTHAHLDAGEFSSDLDDAIRRAFDAGVTKIVTVGTGIESCKRCISLAVKYPQLYAAIGIHPHDAGKATAADIDRLREMARQPKVVGIGETGLDFYRDYSPRDKQAQVFRWQLDLAAECGLPVIIHSRQATRETIDILTEWVKISPPVSGRPRGVIHCFSGDAQAARTYVGLGFNISFAGPVTYPNSRLPGIARTVPVERLVVETDCPYLAPQAHRGRRNEPAYVALTAGALAQALAMIMKDFAKQTTENAAKLFRF